MKKRDFLIIFILLSINCLAKEITLDEFIKSYREKGKYAQINTIDEEQLYYEKKAVVESRENGMTANLKLGGGYFLTDNNSVNLKDKIASGGIEAVVNYKDFYIGASLDYAADKNTYIYNKWHSNDYNFDVKWCNIGYRKNMADIFFNKTESGIKRVEIKEKTVKNNFKRTLLNELEKITDEYIGIKNNEIEIELLRNSLSEIREIKKVVQSKLEYGESVEIEVDYILNEERSLEKKIEYILLRNAKLKTKLCKISGIEYDGEIVIAEMSKIELMEIKIEKPLFDSLELEKQTVEENLKNIKRNKLAGINTVLNYDMENKIISLNIEVGTDIFVYTADEDKSLKDLEKIKIEKEKALEEQALRKQEIELEYRHLFDLYELENEKSDIAFRKYNISKELFIKGNIGVSDYLKVRNEYYDIKLQANKIKNNISGFGYKNGLKE